MKIAKRFGRGEMFLAVVMALCWLVAPFPAKAQKGDNAIWLTGPTKGPSTAFIDASAFCATAGGCSSSTDDFCDVLNQALHALPSTGGVVDARGVSPTNTKSSSCSKNPFNGTHAITTPSTVLLPAGTIPLGKTWVLPNGTKIVGQGAGSPYTTGLASVTTLQAKSTFSGTMIQMGPNASDSPPLTKCASALAGFCTEVAVEDLALQGGTNGANVSGIVNGQSQDMSYVRRVSMYQIGGIGLKVWSSASGSGVNSGPYTDITFDNGGLGSTSTECAELDVSTRGIHGLFCKSETITPSAAVVVNSSNNSIKDVHIQGTSTGGFTDGIQVTSTASSDVLFNITGGTGVTNLVHLKSGANAAQDISIMSVTNGGSSETVLDDVTSTTLNDAYVAMYVLGVSGVAGNGYSRFTTSTNTSPNAVTWGAGSSATLPTSCAKGSLFSYTNSSSGKLYVCTAAGTWSALP